MINSSKSYSFFNSVDTIDTIIKKSFELIGTKTSSITGEQLESARNSVNLILSDWFNRNIHLWTIKTNIIDIVPGKRYYELPFNIQNVLQAFFRTYVRNNLGIAFSSNGGVAADAFDGNKNTACTQNAPNGNIGMQFSSPVSIDILGIISQNDNDYTLIFEGSNDGGNYTPILAIPTQNYKANQSYYFETNLSLNTYLYYRIRETNNATLNIQELYFNNNIQDLRMTEESRSDYIDRPIKFYKNYRCTMYYVDYQITPVMYVWPIPTTINSQLIYIGQSVFETLETFLEAPNIPYAFILALTLGVAEMLATQYAPDRAENLKSRYEDSLQKAITKNVPKVSYQLTNLNG
jgi:hypothetical protein